MTSKEELMKVKANLKKRQPKFIRQDAHKHKRVKQVWRSPKGLHSKMRDSRRGYRVKLQEGYHTPKAVRGLDKHGLLPTLIANAETMKTLDPKKHSLILQKGLGGRKKLAIMDEAHKHKFIIINAKPDAAQKLKDKLHKQHSEKKQRETARAEKHKDLEKKAAHDKKAKEEDEPTAEEKKEELEDEKQKVLHQKE